MFSASRYASMTLCCITSFSSRLLFCVLPISSIYHESRSWDLPFLWGSLRVSRQLLCQIFQKLRWGRNESRLAKLTHYIFKIETSQLMDVAVFQEVRVIRCFFFFLNTLNCDSVLFFCCDWFSLFIFNFLQHLQQANSKRSLEEESGKNVTGLKFRRKRKLTFRKWTNKRCRENFI